MSYYKNLSTKVQRDGIETKNIDFKGLLQGDTMSCCLFLLCFNGVLNFLQVNKNVGALMNSTGVGKKIIALTFADDLTLMTKSLTSMKRILREVNSAMEKLVCISRF